MAGSSAQDDNRDGRGSAPAAPALPRGAPSRIGRFELRAMLGEGAFGRVYRGFDAELRRDVAIKVPHAAGLDDEFRERFLREARAIAAIHHPNVCPVYEVGTEGDLPYIVMRFVAGTTLADVIDGLKVPMAPRSAAMVVRKLALGMAAAHAQGVTHRDLKPANVLYDAANREVLITDFGLARLGGETNLTAKDTFLGTPAYTSPEQADRRIDAVGPLSDVYSLGVILYEMLTGDVPFDGSVMEVAMAHCITPPTPPSQVRPGLDPRLDAIVLKAMAKKPAERFRSARELAEVLTDYLRPGDHAAGPTGSAPELPSVALAGGREPEAATETVAEKLAGRRTAPAFEVVTPPPPAVEVELDEDTEARATKDARRSGNRKSARQSKGGKKKRRRDQKEAGPLAGFRKNPVAWVGAGLSFVALVLLIVFLLKSNKSAPETAQKPTSDAPAAPVTQPQPQPQPKAEPKAGPKVDPMTGGAEDRLRNKLLDRWRITSGFIEPAQFKKWEPEEKYYYLDFKSDGTVRVGIDSFLPDVRLQLLKTGEGRQTTIKFRVVAPEQIEFDGVPSGMQRELFARGQRITAQFDADNLALKYGNTTVRLKRVVLSP
ncbi:MAG: serine/threonine protein kinase [Planctomycetes bacterium]|nr:serine/threonine protein kinase [Planctomycetota bacterium]